MYVETYVADTFITYMYQFLVPVIFCANSRRIFLLRRAATIPHPAEWLLLVPCTTTSTRYLLGKLATVADRLDSVTSTRVRLRVLLVVGTRTQYSS